MSLRQGENADDKAYESEFKSRVAYNVQRVIVKKEELKEEDFETEIKKLEAYQKEGRIIAERFIQELRNQLRTHALQNPDPVQPAELTLVNLARYKPSNALDEGGQLVCPLTLGQIEGTPVPFSTGYLYQANAIAQARDQTIDPSTRLPLTPGDISRANFVQAAEHKINVGAEQQQGNAAFFPPLRMIDRRNRFEKNFEFGMGIFAVIGFGIGFFTFGPIGGLVGGIIGVVVGGAVASIYEYVQVRRERQAARNLQPIVPVEPEQMANERLHDRRLDHAPNPLQRIYQSPRNVADQQPGLPEAGKAADPQAVPPIEFKNPAAPAPPSSEISHQSDSPAPEAPPERRRGSSPRH